MALIIVLIFLLSQLAVVFFVKESKDPITSVKEEKPNLKIC